jgi:hypothetical protein
VHQFEIMDSKTAFLVMLSLAVLGATGQIVYALRTGKAIYGGIFFRPLYVDRAKRPVLYWLIIGFVFAVIAQVGLLLLPRISN